MQRCTEVNNSNCVKLAQDFNGAALICADFDHLPQGKKKYRVSTNDLDILITNWNQANAPAADFP
jgi:hypothetical protein